MTPTDHERYSERLNAYVRGELGPEQTEEIHAHLIGCPMCRQEESALLALSAIHVEELTGEESERLHTAVLTEIQGKPRLAVAPSKAAFVGSRRSWAPRIAQFMAAAAVITLATIYLTNPEVSPIGGADRAAEGIDAGRSRDADQRAAEAGAEGGGGTADQVSEPVEDAADGVSIESAPGNTGTEEDGGTLEGTVASGGAPEPDRQSRSLRANRLRLGAAAAYRGQI